ncbi:N-methyl-D-aspartate receptor NMDAR2C subunit [Ideonella sp.]|uniref:HD domain-containing protein n=1 Tax=Ideonella sp. TaxID=1929293 RepID=UPI0035B19582
MSTLKTEPADLLPLWQQTWALLGAEPAATELGAVLAAWSEPQRHYHDLRHLRECLGRWSAWQHLAERPGEVALALWYHDAVYLPQAGDNERQSADWAVRALGEAGLGGRAAERVHALIMATCHDAPAATPDEQLLIDIDLAVLGAPPARFEVYDADVRQEYAWVPDALYRRKRAEVLQRFLQRPRIYATEAAFNELEAQARRNLAAALAALGG